MKSSYLTAELTYGDYIKGITLTKNPKYIVEFGILDGYSLKSFVESTDETCKIDAFDIFEEFNGNHSDYTIIISQFNNYPRVNIQRGNFYESLNLFKDKSIDIIHIDIANTGEIVPMVEKYLLKLCDDGIIILEGGSTARDENTWMKKYNKLPLNPALKTIENIKYYTCGSIPSITIIKKVIASF
jgi:predicted O-methyltransferase YrrM